MKQICNLFVNVDCPVCNSMHKAPRYLHEYMCPECGESLTCGEEVIAKMHPKKENFT